MYHFYFGRVRLFLSAWVLLRVCGKSTFSRKIVSILCSAKAERSGNYSLPLTGNSHSDSSMSSVGVPWPPAADVMSKP